MATSAHGREQAELLDEEGMDELGVAASRVPSGGDHAQRHDRRAKGRKRRGLATPCERKRREGRNVDGTEGIVLYKGEEELLGA